jgi:hypothetical protein
LRINVATKVVAMDTPDSKHLTYRFNVSINKDVLVYVVFIVLLILNIWVFLEANYLSFLQKNQPYDFYSILRASSQVWTKPNDVYVFWNTVQLPSFWQKWCWSGSDYAYTPMFAALLSPLSALFPTSAKIIWEVISLFAVTIAGFISLKMFKGFKTRLFFLLMIFIMPFQLLYFGQAISQYPLLPQNLAMTISPVYFTEYFWGDTNVLILLFGLLSIWCSTFSTVKIPFLGKIRNNEWQVPGYVLSSLFLALGSFQATVLLFYFPFWLLLNWFILNRKNLIKAIAYFAAFVVMLNFIIFIHPTLFSGYANSFTELFNYLINYRYANLYSFATASGPSLQDFIRNNIYSYVWIFTLPLASIFTLWNNRKGGIRLKPYSILGATLFSAGFGLSAYIFTVVQILNSYPFYPSLSPDIFGGDLVSKSLPLTLTQTLEVGVVLASVGLFIWKASSLGKLNGGAILCAFGFTLLVIGAMGAAIVYTEIHLVWGELWLGFTVWKFWWSLPAGGGGWPWGTWRVAYNTCFIKAWNFTEADPNCIFMNYNDVLYISILMVIIGFILFRHYARNRKS